MDILLTFTGYHDPYFKGLVDQEEHPGPILSLLTTRSFDHIFLFDTPSTQRVTGEAKDAIAKIHRCSKVHVLEINLADPTRLRYLGPFPCYRSIGYNYSRGGQMAHQIIPDSPILPLTPSQKGRLAWHA